MEVKEAIEYLEEEIERLKDWNRMQEGYLSKPTKTDIYRGKLIQVLTLLQQGEKYRQMWEEIVKLEYNDEIIVRSDLEEILQKYFPKEE